MKRLLVLILIIFSFLTIIATHGHAFWWMVYHKPAFKGKVIDAETKEPIEGAVVVVVYEKYPIISGPGGGSASVMNIKEVLTNKDGKFYIPSYTTIIQPFSVEGYANFIIFKPGYGSFPDWRVNPPKNLMMYYENWRFIDFEEFFSGKVGTVKEVWVKEAWVMGAIPKKMKVTFGIVEIPKLKTKEERRKALPSIPGPDIPSRFMKNLIRLSNEERISLGFDPEVFP